MFRIAVVAAALLGPALASATRLDPPRCKSVPDCVALAEKTPTRFSPTLYEELEKLSGAVLIDGLKFIHKNAEVNTLIRRHIHGGLTHQDGHTAASAEALLKLALAVQDERLQQSWIELLAKDKEGRPVLARFIDGAEKNELRLLTMLSYVSHTGEKTPSQITDEIKAGKFECKSECVPPLRDPLI